MNLDPLVDHHQQRRRLDDILYDANLHKLDETDTWKVIYTCLVLAGMLGLLMYDRCSPDSVMLMTLTMFMVAEIVSIEQAVAGFANPGLLTIIVLFVVAEGISQTGALDYYLGKLLGRNPHISTPSAQLRLMIPVACTSAFINNTPLVALGLPIVKQWAQQVRVPVQQMLIPLSWAAILGGACSLIGTSTNLVVMGLLQERYPDNPDMKIKMFDVGKYGVPVAMTGMAYIILMSQFLLPGGKYASCSTSADKATLDDTASCDSWEDVFMGARLTKWSPANARMVQFSGLRETEGIYLVSVCRPSTDRLYRAVPNDLILATNDVLYFTGPRVESFGQFCEEHGLEMVTHENEVLLHPATHLQEPEPSQHQQQLDEREQLRSHPQGGPRANSLPTLLRFPNSRLETVEEHANNLFVHPIEVGVTKKSLLRANEIDRKRNIDRIADYIHGTLPKYMRAKVLGEPHDPAKIIATFDKELILIAVNARDRLDLLLDINKALQRFKLLVRHTEAAVVKGRSLSIWRCETTGTDLLDEEEIWSVLHALLADNNNGIQAVKHRGIRVIRAQVLKGSSLIDKTPAEINNFRERYKAAIVAIKKKEEDNKNATLTELSTIRMGGGGKKKEGIKNNTFGELSTVRIGAGDVLVLQASEDSPLLERPPRDFHQKNKRKVTTNVASTGMRATVARYLSRNFQTAPNHDSTQDEECPTSQNEPDCNQSELQEAVWRDLFALSPQPSRSETGEFLAAMKVAPNSHLAGKTAHQAGIHKLPDLFLVSIDRPIPPHEAPMYTLRLNDSERLATDKLESKLGPMGVASIDEHSIVCAAVADENYNNSQTSSDDWAPVGDYTAMLAVDPDNEPLAVGDTLWFAGPASAIGDLRKIPGLTSHQHDQVSQINCPVYDRRLVQAVVARHGPLVGKTVRELKFRSTYGAVVICLQREGKRIHDFPQNVRLQAGDVLLLEAGPSLLDLHQKNKDLGRMNEQQGPFVLLAQVENSAPPRLRMLVPALLITIGMLAMFMSGLVSLLVSGLVASTLMVLLGILSEAEARAAIKWDIYVCIASAFGIGMAMINTGISDAVANFLVDIGEATGFGDAGLVAAVYLATALISNVVTNSAAAALMFPVAMNAAADVDMDRLTMAFTLMLGASASFILPYGYTTNLLVFRPGAYRAVDFVKMGLFLQILLWIVSVLCLAVIESAYLTWMITGGFLLVVSLGVIGIPTALQRPQETQDKRPKGQE